MQDGLEVRIFEDVDQVSIQVSVQIHDVADDGGASRLRHLLCGDGMHCFRTLMNHPTELISIAPLFVAEERRLGGRDARAR